MIPGSDTAKEDITLVIVGAVAALLFFWVYSDIHPLSVADSSYGKIPAQNRAVEMSGDFGFVSDEEPVTRFMAHSDLIDSLQKQTDLRKFYENPQNPSLYPVYFWETKFKMASGETPPAFGFDMEPARTIDIHLSQSGELLAVKNRNNLLPSVQIRKDVLRHVLRTDTLELPSGIPEGNSGESRFRFSESGNEFNSRQAGEEGVVLLDREAAERMAGYYLQHSGWPEDLFSIQSASVTDRDGTEVFQVEYEHHNAEMRNSVRVTIALLPGGSLFEMDYDFPADYETNRDTGIVTSGIRSILFLGGFFWIVVLLFMRFRDRLIDMKSAVLVAVLAGFMFPFVLALEQTYRHFHAFGAFDFSFLLPLGISVGFIAAFSSIGFFAVTAISDSITRENWIEKLRTIDFLRTGHFNNIPVGLTAIRGIAYSFVIALLWCGTLFLVPESYLTVDSPVFRSDTTYLPYITVIIQNFALSFLIAEIAFLIIVGQVRSTFRSPAVLVAVPAVLFGLIYPFGFDVGGLTTELISAGVVGLGAGWVYYREDFLTTFISLFLFMTLVAVSGGWLVDSSPDRLLFWVYLFLIATGFLAGLYSIYRGKPVKELPEFIPEYIHELAQEDRIRQELQIARKVQQSFLPVRTPAVEGFDIAAICKPAYETGGDYYDFIPFDDGRMAVTIGDVSGKGIQAAFFMTFTKGVLHALCNEYESTIEVLSKTNKLFRKNANKGTFISLIFGILDSKKGSFCFSRAGHNPLLYFDSKKRELHEYQPEGIAVGMADVDLFRKHIREQEIEMAKDDLIILFTDGVVESISKTNKVYGDVRLHNLIKKNHDLPARELIEKLEKDLERFEEMTEQHDDMTMIIIKKR